MPRHREFGRHYNRPDKKRQEFPFIPAFSKEALCIIGGVSGAFSLKIGHIKFARFFAQQIEYGGDFLQEAKHRPLALPAAYFFRMLLFLLATLLLVPFFPAAQAAQPDSDSETRYVLPLGRAVGIKLFSEGVLVVGLSDVSTSQGPVSPARTCGLREGDVITSINRTQVNSIEQVQAVLQQTQEQALNMEVKRGETREELTAQAVQCSTDGAYKLGAWIRDSMAGIGTLTFTDPSTGLFGTLGHGINDIDTSVLMTLQSGAILPATVENIVKGVDGKPGELRGRFDTKTDWGTLYANTPRGVFGHLDQTAQTLSGTPVPVARPEQVHTGSATILANIVGNSVEEYTVEIVKLFPDAADSRDLMLKVTDPKLLEQTGGIVQGMSGSPILQDGRLVGAVTHVLIDHADRGYGILAQHMLEAAESAAQAG